MYYVCVYIYIYICIKIYLIYCRYDLLVKPRDGREARVSRRVHDLCIYIYIYTHTYKTIYRVASGGTKRRNK